MATTPKSNKKPADPKKSKIDKLAEFELSDKKQKGVIGSGPHGVSIL